MLLAKGAIPWGKLRKVEEWIEYNQCGYEEDDKSDDYLNETNKAATDGSERADLCRHAKQTTAAAIVISKEGNHCAALKALVPGRQTIP